MRKAEMDTTLFSCSSAEETAYAMQECGALIRRGELVAFPTETVYGLGANALDAEAVARIFRVKNRPADNPLIAHISGFEMISRVVSAVPEGIEALTRRFWPGPLTVVFPRGKEIPAVVSAGLDTVAVRCPSHPIANQLIRAAGVPVVAPSANLSGRPSPTCFAHCKEDLGGKVAAIIDGGSCEIGLESTVVLPLGNKRLKLLRPGGITAAMLEDAGFHVEMDPAILAPVRAGQKVSSPGMLHRHYAPRAPLTVVTGDPEAVCSAIINKQGPRIWVLAFDEYLHCFDQALSFGSETDSRSQARALFQALRQFDSLPCDQIYAMKPSGEGEGLAVCNRLLRAASFHMIPAERL